MAQSVAPIAPNPFTFDALMKVHMQLPTTPESRPTQVPRSHTHTVPTYHTPIEVQTLVPGLDPKRTLLSPFNDVVWYEAYRLDSTTGHVRERRSRDPPIEETTVQIVTYVAPVGQKETDLVALVFVEITRRTGRTRSRQSRSRTSARVFARRRYVVLRFRYDDRYALAKYDPNIYVALRCALADRQIPHGYGATGRVRSSNVNFAETERKQK